MIGSLGAGELAAAWLTTRLPVRLRLLEARLGLNPLDLPNPALVEDHETGPLGIEYWPAVYVLPQKLTKLEAVETSAGWDRITEPGVEPAGYRPSETYRATYSIRFLMWVRSDDYDSTDRLRKLYALAVRECLLERRQLTLPAAYAAVNYGVDTSVATVSPTTIREDYAGLVVPDAGATIAGAYVDVDISFTEVLEPTDLPLGIVDEVRVDTAHLPPHPGA